MLLLYAEEAYRLWAASYDSDPNPILALERRVIGERLNVSPGQFVLDIGAGTGYWLEHARSLGANAYGIDLSAEMLSEAAKKPGLHNRLICADMNRLPVQDEVADLAICSMAIGYLPAVAQLFRELARVSRRVIVSDLHPDATEAGWRRRFEAADERFEIEQFAHRLVQLDGGASDAGFHMEWRLTSHLGEPERDIFIRAGREHAFAAACGVPALLSTCWTRP